VGEGDGAVKPTTPPPPPPTLLLPPEPKLCREGEPEGGAEAEEEEGEDSGCGVATPCGWEGAAEDAAEEKEEEGDAVEIWRAGGGGGTRGCDTLLLKLKAD
jgi:hypothetical protein